jgi:peptidoglycan/LPS O-acetylase OafA/YrhL
MLAGCLLSWMLLVLGLMQNQPAAMVTHSSWLGGQFHQPPDLIAAAVEPLRLLLGSAPNFATSYDSSLWTMPIEFGASRVLMTIFVLLRRVRRPSERVAGYAFCLLAVLCIGSFFSLFAFGAGLRLLQPQRSSSARGSNRLRLAAILGLSKPLEVCAQMNPKKACAAWTSDDPFVGLAAKVCLGVFFGTVPFSADRWHIYNWLAAFSHHFVSHARFWPQTPESVWHGLGAALCLLAVCSCRPVQAAMSRPTGVFLGRISFPLYILHIPILMVIECNALLFFQKIGLSPLAGELLSFAAFVAVSVAVAAMLTPLIERGAIALSSRLGSVIDRRIRRPATRNTGPTDGPTADQASTAP